MVKSGCAEPFQEKGVFESRKNNHQLKENPCKVDKKKDKKTEAEVIKKNSACSSIFLFQKPALKNFLLKTS